MAENNAVNVQFNADVAAFNEDMQKMLADLKKIFAEMQKTSDNAGKKTKETTKSSGELFKTLEHSAGSSLMAIMKGTETWHQATQKVLADLEMKFAQVALKAGLEFAKMEIGNLLHSEKTAESMVKTNEAKNATIAAGDSAASKAGLLARVEKTLKSIGADAAEAYSGVFAFMSPVMGPLAAIPAGIAYASVAAMEGLVSLDVGAWELGSDMVAQLHQGEMVVPQTFAQGLRDGSGLGGGDNYTINISAIDTQTGTQFLRNNASGIAAALSSQVRNFNSSVSGAWKS